MALKGDTKRQAYLRMRANESVTIYHSGPDVDEIFNRWILGSLTSESLILDIGCGTGHLLTSLIRKVGNLVPFMIGLDVSMDMIGYAKRLSDEITWLVADQASLPLEDSSIDIALSRLADYTPSQVARTLKPGGVFMEYGLGPLDSKEIAEAFGERFLEVYDPSPNSSYLVDRTEQLEMYGLFTKRFELVQYTEYMSRVQLEDVIEMVPLVQGFDRIQDSILISQMYQERSCDKGLCYPVTRQITLRTAQLTALDV